MQLWMIRFRLLLHCTLYRWVLLHCKRVCLKVISHKSPQKNLFTKQVWLEISYIHLYAGVPPTLIQERERLGVHRPFLEKVFVLGSEFRCVDVRPKVNISLLKQLLLERPRNECHKDNALPRHERGTRG